jgi:hypothetical protein
VAGVVGVATLVAGLAAWAAAASWWAVVLAGLVPVAAAAVVARRRLYGSVRLAAVPSARRTFAAWLVTLAAAVHVAWVAAWAWSPAWVLLLLPVLPVLAWAECGVTLLVRQHVLRARTRTRADVAAQRQRQQLEAPAAVRKFRAALDEGEWGYVQVDNRYEQRGPACNVFHCTVPARATARLLQEATSEKRTLIPFDESSGPVLARALSQVLEIPLREKWVTVQSTGYAGYYDVTVLTRDVMADIRPFVDDLSPVDLSTPCPLGVQSDGSVGALLLQGHGVIVAASGVGKSNLLIQITSFLVRTGAVVWAAGRRKQYETWAQYLLKYLDTRHKMVIDWLVNGQYDTVELLLATWLLAQDRLATPFDERDDWAPLYVILDEATDVLTDTSVVIEYQGEWYDASRLMGMISRGVKAAHMYLIIVLHRYVNGQFGHEGGNIKVAFDWTIVLRSNDPGDAPRALGTGSLPPLEHPGELYARRAGGPVLRIKASYVQEVGKPQAPQTGGVTIPEVGWARRGMANTLHGRSAAAAGSHYADRHQYVTQDLMAYLQRGDDDVRPTVTGRGPASQARRGGRAADIEDRAYRETLAKLEAAAGLRPAAEVTDVAPAARRKVARRDLVVQLLREHGAMDSGRLIELLRQNGDAVTNPNAVYNLLAGMRDREGVLVQHDDKTFDLADRVAAA